MTSETTTSRSTCGIPTGFAETTTRAGLAESASNANAQSIDRRPVAHLAGLGHLPELPFELVDLVAEPGGVLESEVFRGFMHFLFEAHHESG